MSMKIIMVTPAPPGSRKGNRVTALRWAKLLRELGHRVLIRQQYQGEPADLLIALHARRSFAAVEAFRRAQPGRPIVLALTGTDLYKAIHKDPFAQRALDLASRLVVLQPLAIKELPLHLRARARVIYQSCQAPAWSTRRPRIEDRGSRIKNGGLKISRRTGSFADPQFSILDRRPFDVCVLGHLRPVKDPFRTARAARLLPASSRIRVLHAGAALSREMEHQARSEERINSRYHWLGDLPRWKALRLLARSRLMVLSSRMEGGANTISEAIAVGTPILASHIPGSVGLLGDYYPGYFPVGDTAALAVLLSRAETDKAFYRELKGWCRSLQLIVRPRRERASWRSLLYELEKISRLPKSPVGPATDRKRRTMPLSVNRGSERKPAQEAH
jgi:glycosyltransferase involved in cell wall biosynthesis